MNVEIDTSSINKLSNELLNSIKDLETNIQALTNYINIIKQFWSGVDSNTYITTMKEKNIKELIKVKDILLEYEKFLMTTPKIYQSLDEAYGSKSIG